MKNKGCAFEVKGGGLSSYYVSPQITGLVDFVRFLHDRASIAESPQPMQKRIPQVEQVSEAVWRKIAEGGEDTYSGIFILDIEENRLWANEDRGDGMALYAFPLSETLKAAVSGTADLWERLLAMFPGAKLS